jgi:D-alanine transaminase
MIVYFNGQLIPKEEVRISPDDRGFLFADGVYEVIASYSGRLFRPDTHFRRLERSLRELCIALPDLADLRSVTGRLIEVNELAEGGAGVYIQITRGVAPRNHSFPDPAVSPTVYASAFPFEMPREEQECGVKVILVPDIRWARCDAKSVALLPNVLACQRAVEDDAAEAVFVRDGVVTEGSRNNVCAVFDGRLVTYPKTNYILPGVTRDVVLELCGQLDIPFDEAPILEGQLQEADELMIVGTLSEIVPVVRVDDWTVSDGKPGPVTRRLQRAFRETVRREC